MHRYLAFVLVALLVACTSVDSTEHCIETRYGKVVTNRMGNGLNTTIFTNSTCFPLTEQNFPNDGSVQTMEAQTSSTGGSTITISGDVSIVYEYDPETIMQVFRDKRTPEAVEVQILNSIREGYRNAIAGWTISEIFSPRRELLSDSVRAHIQRKVGSLARIKQVYVRNIVTPPQLDSARVAAARLQQVLDSAQQQSRIDSVNSSARVMRARAEAESNRLMAQSYAQHPALLQLRIAEEFARGLSGACVGRNGNGQVVAVQTCVIGGSVMDRMATGFNNR